MLESSNLSASELLTAFIDGEIDSSDTQMLFYQLANDPDLQAEMQELMAMRNAFSNTQTQTPPPDLQSKILNSTVYKNSITGKAAYLSAFLSNNYFRIPASVAMIILIGVFSFWLVNDNKNSEAEFLKSDFSEIVNNDDFDNSNDFNNITNDNTDKTNLKSNNIQDNNRINSEYGYSEFDTNQNSKSNKSSDNLNKEIQDNNDITFNIRDINLARASFDNVFPPEKSVNRKDYINFYNLGKGINKFLDNVSFSFKKQSLISNPNPKIESYENPLLNDFSLNLNYHINDNNLLGVEIGREYFPMLFKGTEISGNRELEFEYPLAYNATWIGLSYTYYFSDASYSGSFSPYTGITLGGTSVGPLAKVSLGANYFINENIGIFAGLKYGSLFYSHQNNIFITSKYGIDYGLIIKL